MKKLSVQIIEELYEQLKKSHRHPPVEFKDAFTGRSVAIDIASDGLYFWAARNREIVKIPRTEVDLFIDGVKRDDFHPDRKPDRTVRENRPKV